MPGLDMLHILLGVAAETILLLPPLKAMQKRDVTHIDVSVSCFTVSSHVVTPLESILNENFET
jgi:hypothetical protein